MEKPAVAAPPDIPSLSAGLARGEESAFQDFYALYFDRLLRYLLALSRGREDLARDALQSTLIRVAKHARRFETEAAFWSWLAVLARSALVDEQRKSARYGSFLSRWFAHSEIHRDAAKAVSEEDTEKRLTDSLELALERLPDDERALAQSKYFDGQSVRDIASALGASEKAVESRLTRLRRKLKDLILEDIAHE